MTRKLATLGRRLRRVFLVFGVLASCIAVIGCGSMWRCYRRGQVASVPEREVHDVTGLVRIAPDHVAHPKSADEVASLLVGHDGPVSIGGGRFSQGGQIGVDGTLFLDLRGMDDVIAFDPANRTIRVEAGITWRKIQETIDSHDLALKIMQSYANFTVGGSLSVNSH